MMTKGGSPLLRTIGSRRERILSGIAVAVAHALALYLLATGFGLVAPVAPASRLTLFDVPPTPIPPPAPQAPNAAERGETAPPALRAQTTPVVAPPPAIRLETPPPIVAAPVAGPGRDLGAGVSDRPGPGTGSVGQGAGTGGGGTGRGTGPAIRARWLSGAITNADYPRDAWNAGGAVIASFTVDTVGRPRGCAILESSGQPALDAITCRLIEARFRYAPARDAEGRAIPAIMGWRQAWWFEPRRR